MKIVVAKECVKEEKIMVITMLHISFISVFAGFYTGPEGSETR